MPDRIQQEVEELLARLDKFPPRRSLRYRLSRAAKAPFRAIGNFFVNLNLPHIHAGHILLAAVTILVVAFVAGGSGGLWTWVIAGAILMFIAAFVWSLRQRSRPPSQKYWRDRPMDLNDRSSRRGPRNRR
jgi:energy-coupling factor transporter transmembrane protein EcfT